jgi:hypothetical protein
MKKDKHQLSGERKRELAASIHEFKRWLEGHKRVRLDETRKNTIVTFPRPTSSDWIMQVEGTEIQFNTYVVNRCSFEFFRMVVLHECFHLFVQDVPNKSDAKRLRDDFGDIFMKLLDIEADYYTAMFYKEVRHASLVDVFSLFHEGSRIFGDPRIRTPKVERFIGAVLSIANAYFKNPTTKITADKELYLPSISNIPIDESMHVLVSRANHFMLAEIRADLHDFLNIKKCYTQTDGGGVREYVETLLQFASKALRTRVSPTIYKHLHALGEPTAILAAG